MRIARLRQIEGGQIFINVKIRPGLSLCYYKAESYF